MTKGHNLCVYNRTASKADNLVKNGKLKDWNNLKGA